MGFRTVEITGPAELHVRQGLLIIEKERKTLGIPLSETDSQKQKKTRTGTKGKRKPAAVETVKISVPLEDIRTLVCMGASVRISTMAMAQLCQNKITTMMLDEKYRPAGILTAYESNAQQSLIMRKQVYADTVRRDILWKHIVAAKIRNQANALSLLGLPGRESVLPFAQKAEQSTIADIDPIEAAAAKCYFQYLCPDMNRRDDTPMNSRLNYGYSIIRNSMVRAIIAAGLLPAFGIHHQNQFNAYNLADDLMEPFRPFVDMIAFGMDGDDEKLTREERKKLAEVTVHAALLDQKKVSVLRAIDHVVNDVRSYFEETSDTVHLPDILPIESLSQIKE